MSSSQQPSEVAAWKRGDLVLVDGTKEGAVVSVNGNMAQVSLWDAQAAAVNVSRLSPLEPIEWDHNAGPKNSVDEPQRADPVSGRADEPWMQVGEVIDAAPRIRCYPEAGIVMDSHDGPVLTVDPLDGGDCWVVHMGDVARWLAEHGDEQGFQPTDTVTLHVRGEEETFTLPTHIAESVELALKCASVGDESGLREHLAPLLRRLSVSGTVSNVEPELCPGCRRHMRECNADPHVSPKLTIDCKARRARLLTGGPKKGKSLAHSLLKSIADGPPQWLLRRDPLVQAVLADSLCFIVHQSNDHVTLAPTHKGLTLLETQQ